MATKMFEIVSPWTRDERAVDPVVQMCTVRVDGYLFTVYNVVGPGWPMTIRPAFGDGPRFTIAVVDWEAWDKLEHQTREWLEGR